LYLQDYSIEPAQEGGMGNDWLADAWGDNPLSDPAISDAETISDAAEGKATGFSD